MSKELACSDKVIDSRLFRSLKRGMYGSGLRFDGLEGVA